MKPIFLALSFCVYFSALAGQPEEMFTVFPNPTNTGYFTLKFNQTSKHYKYSMIDFTGNEIIKGKASSDFEKKVIIDVSTLPIGNYFLIVSNGESRLTKKITIKD